MRTTTPHSRAGRIIERASGIWSELDYAQRRLFEIRTALPEASRVPRRRGEEADGDSASRADSSAYQVRAWDEFDM